MKTYRELITERMQQFATDLAVELQSANIVKLWNSLDAGTLMTYLSLAEPYHKTLLAHDGEALIDLLELSAFDVDKVAIVTTFRSMTVTKAATFWQHVDWFVKKENELSN